MRSKPKYLQRILLGATGVVFAGAQFISPDGDAESASGVAAVWIVPGIAEAATLTDIRRSTGFINEASRGASSLAVKTETALAALAPAVRAMSHPSALENAFNSYFAYKAGHPDQVRKPYLYFVDYGLPSSTPRGYVFDMDELAIIDGPFTVAHGRGSATQSETVPTRFSNVHGSNATSLGLYLAQETYNFSGTAGGKRYTSIGLRLKGLSQGFNDNARTRGVVAHGAPYVSATRAGRSEGCPAVTQERARTLMPKLANGGMVFLFAPDARWMAADPWLETAKQLAANEEPVATRRAN